MIEKIKAYLKKEIGWGELILLGCMAGIFIWVQIQRYQRNADPAFAKGIITGTRKGAKGSVYWEYKFYAGEEIIQNTMPYDNAYRIGDTINIKYQADDPKNAVNY